MVPSVTSNDKTITVIGMSVAPSCTGYRRGLRRGGAFGNIENLMI